MITFEGSDDLTGRTVIISDDEILSGRSLVLAAETAVERGTGEIHAFVTDGILSGQGVRRIAENCITKLYITDTVEFDRKAAGEAAGKPLKKIETLAVSSVFAEAIIRIHEGRSLSSLFLGK